jgi:hypothetical protein
MHMTIFTHALFRSDLHTEGHTQWFYYAVSNTHPAAIVKLSEQVYKYVCMHTYMYGHIFGMCIDKCVYDMYIYSCKGMCTYQYICMYVYVYQYKYDLCISI